MIKRTQIHLIAVLLIAFASFINIVVVVEFLPSVAEITIMHICTAALRVAFNRLVFEPVRAVRLLVLESIQVEQLPTEILLVVRVDTGFPVVLHIERTENSLVQKDVEFLVRFHQMKQLYPEFVFLVHK